MASAQQDVQLHDFSNIFGLKGKVAVVSGGSRGLGLHAASGYKLFSAWCHLPNPLQSSPSRLLQDIHHLTQSRRLRRCRCSSQCAPQQIFWRPGLLHPCR
ncbi:bile acid 7-dehydroxylase 1/3 [Alternaria alternata]|nr:bile acid 7-dehydroxylase 1/3 [Alternaria alternata]